MREQDREAFVARVRAMDGQSALEYLDALLGHAPSDIEALLLRGKLRYESGDLAGTLADAEQAIRIAPQRAMPHYLRAAVLTRHQRLDEALVDLQQGHRFETGAPESKATYHVQLAAILQRRGRLAEAVLEYDRALAARPGNLGTLYNRARCLLDAGHHQEAADDLTLCLKAAPDWGRALHGRAEAWLGLGADARAVVDCTAALRADPGDARAHYFRARALARLGDSEGAASDRRAAEDLDLPLVRALDRPPAADGALGVAGDDLPFIRQTLRLLPLLALVTVALILALTAATSGLDAVAATLWQLRAVIVIVVIALASRYVRRLWR